MPDWWLKIICVTIGLLPENSCSVQQFEKRWLFVLFFSHHIFLIHFLNFCFPALAETDLEDMAMHETEDNKVFQRFKKRIAPEPHQVTRTLVL